MLHRFKKNPPQTIIGVGLQSTKPSEDPEEKMFPTNAIMKPRRRGKEWDVPLSAALLADVLPVVTHF
jgi:hypothetical protein